MIIKLIHDTAVEKPMPENNLCKKCKHRFRRVFIPLDPEQYVDDEGKKVFSSKEENIVIMNTCLIAGVDIESEITIACEHFEPREETMESTPGLFKHLK